MKKNISLLFIISFIFINSWSEQIYFKNDRYIMAQIIKYEKKKLFLNYNSDLYIVNEECIESIENKSRILKLSSFPSKKRINFNSYRKIHKIDSKNIDKKTKNFSQRVDLYPYRVILNDKTSYFGTIEYVRNNKLGLKCDDEIIDIDKNQIEVVIHGENAVTDSIFANFNSQSIIDTTKTDSTLHKNANLNQKKCSPIRSFKNEKVRIILQDNIDLYGTIEEVKQDSIWLKIEKKCVSVNNNDVIVIIFNDENITDEILKINRIENKEEKKDSIENPSSKKKSNSSAKIITNKKEFSSRISFRLLFGYSPKGNHSLNYKGDLLDKYDTDIGFQAQLEVPMFYEDFFIGAGFGKQFERSIYDQPEAKFSFFPIYGLLGVQTDDDRLPLKAGLNVRLGFNIFLANDYYKGDCSTVNGVYFSPGLFLHYQILYFEFMYQYNSGAFTYYGDNLEVINSSICFLIGIQN